MIRKFRINIFHISKVASNETSTLQTIYTWITLTEQKYHSFRPQGTVWRLKPYTKRLSYAISLNLKSCDSEFYGKYFSHFKSCYKWNIYLANNMYLDNAWNL